MTLRVHVQPLVSQLGDDRSSSSRESRGPRRSSSRNTYRRKPAFAFSHSFARRCHAYRPRAWPRISARISARSSRGQMRAAHSKSSRSSHSKRSSSLRSKPPRRLQRTRCWGAATVAIGSSWRKPSCRMVASTPRADPSRSCARTAILRASLTSTCRGGIELGQQAASARAGVRSLVQVAMRRRQQTRTRRRPRPPRARWSWRDPSPRGRKQRGHPRRRCRGSPSRARTPLRSSTGTASGCWRSCRRPHGR